MQKNIYIIFLFIFSFILYGFLSSLSFFFFIFFLSLPLGLWHSLFLFSSFFFLLLYPEASPLCFFLFSFFSLFGWDWLWWWLGCVILATHNGRSWVIFQIGFMGFGLWLLLYHGGVWSFCGGGEYFCKWICLRYLAGFVWFCFELCFRLWAVAVVVGWWRRAMAIACWGGWFF